MLPRSGGGRLCRNIRSAGRGRASENSGMDWPHIGAELDTHGCAILPALLSLAGIANRWNEALGDATRFPAELAEYLEQCHAAGQAKPTPLLLQYGAGDY